VPDPDARGGGAGARSLKRASAILTWGAKKLLAFLSGRHPDGWTWPARSTVCDLLARHGLIRKPRAGRRVGHPDKPSTAMSAPNLVWCADFKGQFKTRRPAANLV